MDVDTRALRVRFFNAVVGSPVETVGRGFQRNCYLCIPNQGELEKEYLCCLGELSALQALAQDQKTALEQMLWSCPGLRHIRVATYDGDTPRERRAGQFLFVHSLVHGGADIVDRD